jgi:transposase
MLSLDCRARRDIGMKTEVMASPSCPEVEVLAKPERRRFTVEYKKRILREADKCTRPGEIGALLRREGLYSSSLTHWRRARDRGDLLGTGIRKRGPEGRPVDRRDRRISELGRENRRLKSRLERAEALIDVQKKVSELLGVDLPEPEEGSAGR